MIFTIAPRLAYMNILANIQHNLFTHLSIFLATFMYTFGTSKRRCIANFIDCNKCFLQRSTVTISKSLKLTFCIYLKCYYDKRVYTVFINFETSGVCFIKLLYSS